jgi:hypothetical protein
MIEDAITMTHGAEIVLDSVSDKERKHLFDLLKHLAKTPRDQWDPREAVRLQTDKEEAYMLVMPRYRINAFISINEVGQIVLEHVFDREVLKYFEQPKNGRKKE